MCFIFSCAMFWNSSVFVNLSFIRLQWVYGETFEMRKDNFTLHTFKLEIFNFLLGITLKAFMSDLFISFNNVCVSLYEVYMKCLQSSQIYLCVIYKLKKNIENSIWGSWSSLRLHVKHKNFNSLHCQRHATSVVKILFF